MNSSLIYPPLQETQHTSLLQQSASSTSLPRWCLSGPRDIKSCFPLHRHHNLPTITHFPKPITPRSKANNPQQPQLPSPVRSSNHSNPSDLSQNPVLLRKDTRTAVSVKYAFLRLPRTHQSLFVRVRGSGAVLVQEGSYPVRSFFMAGYGGCAWWGWWCYSELGGDRGGCRGA